jgi:hypothetical protein
MLLACLTACASLGVAGTAAWGQTYPNKTVRIIVPAATGGPDVVARLVAAQLAAQTGQSFIVENKPGANGILGADAVAKAPPDGYTLMVYSSGFVINPAIYKKLPYDTEHDFVPVTNIVINDGLFIVVNPALPAQTLQEFIALARAPDSKVAYSSPGVGNRSTSPVPLQRARRHEDAARPVQGRRAAAAAVVAERGAGNVLLPAPRCRISRAVRPRDRLGLASSVRRADDHQRDSLRTSSGMFAGEHAARSSTSSIAR